MLPPQKENVVTLLYPFVQKKFQLAHLKICILEKEILIVIHKIYTRQKLTATENTMY